MIQARNQRALASREEAPTPLPEKDSSILSGLPHVLTLKQTALLLGIGITTARQMCREERLPAFKVGQQWRVPRAWLSEAINNGGII